MVLYASVFADILPGFAKTSQKAEQVPAAAPGVPDRCYRSDQKSQSDCVIVEPVLQHSGRSRNSGGILLSVELLFPLFFLERIGCWNWGLVAGLSQTYEPWESIWERLNAGERMIDITKWQHDLFRPNLLHTIRRKSS